MFTYRIVSKSRPALYIKDKKQVIEEINIEDELKNQISYNKNVQLNQFSTIYFNKIKKDVIISEK